MQIMLTPRRTRDEVVDVLRRLIVSGELAPTERLEEVELSKRMGVSRTPIREALITLESEGWIRSAHNRGATVIPADEKMVCEVYPILGALEAEALRLSAPALKNGITDLRKINDKLFAESRRGRQYALDTAFHRRLVRDCGNERLLRLIEIEWSHAARFDGAAYRGTANHHGSWRQHEEIIDAIGAGEIDRAATLLRRHWELGISVVRKWLRNEG